MFFLGLENNDTYRRPSADVKAGVFKLLTNLIYCKDFFARARRFLGENVHSSLVKSTSLLFPVMSVVKDIANKSALFPKLCAADDLDLSLNGQHDQIEFFNFVGNDQLLDQRYHTSQYDFKQPVSMSATTPAIPINSYEVKSEAYENELFNSNYSQPEHNYVLPSVSQYVPQDGYSHYYLNMIGMQHPESNSAQPYFNDFANLFDLNGAVLSSSSVSSVESHISPLDDEFFKRLSNEEFKFEHSHTLQPVLHQQPVKKRKFNSISSNHTMERNSITSLSPTDSLDVRVKKEPSSRIKKPKMEESSRKLSMSETQFECPHCDASFKVKGYLSRHLKKHSSAKAFLCPFYEEPMGVRAGSKCHPTGGFSRRDTFKTHLKALHFIYPPGTKSSERNSISGRCAGCFLYFESNAQWLEKHIETGECTGTVQCKKHQHQEELKI